MSKKAIFAQSSHPYWIDVAAELQNRYGWEICYFIGGGKQKGQAAKLFPNAVFHTKNEARKSLPPKGSAKIPSSPLDKTLISDLSFHESIFMKMLDRHDYAGTLTYNKRIITYHSQVMYWKSVLEYYKPDVVAYRIAPHASYDYILYALSRLMNIPTVMFERTSLPGYVYPVNSFEDRSMRIWRTYTRMLEETERKHEIMLSTETATYMKNLTKSYAQAMPLHLKYKLRRFRKGGDIGGALSILFLTVMETVKELLLKNRDREYLHKKYYENMGRFKRKKLFAHYRRLARPVDLSLPFVFVALQCEPERQTCPVGGVFGNQYLMVDLLSKLVPEGWKVYVKEHTSQFKGYQAAERSRTFEFYDMIASMPNVELAPLDYTSFELIDKAQASATVSGTVGWESVVRGKPALLFGNSWYRDCKGVFTIHTVENGKEAIQQIKNGFTVNTDDVKGFVQAVESCSVRGYIDRVYHKMNIISPKENVENLARAIHEFCA